MTDAMAHTELPTTTTTPEVVAQAAGVSRAAVSRAVNGDSRVSAETRRAVEKAIAQLGYSPNRAARSLVTRRSDSIGLVVPEPTTKLFGDPFFPRLVRGISEVVSASDMQLVLLAPQSPADEERLRRYVTSGHVDGVLLVSLHGNDPLPTQLAAAGIPVVVGGRPPAGTSVSYVDMDNVEGARAAVSTSPGTAAGISPRSPARSTWPSPPTASRGTARRSPRRAWPATPSSRPRELDEAAMIDGAGPWRILRSVIVPQAIPAIVAVSLFHFFWAWNEYFLPLVYLQGVPEQQPLSVGLGRFNALYSNEPTLLQAGAILAMALPVVVFFLAQRAFMRGVVFGGVEK